MFGKFKTQRVNAEEQRQSEIYKKLMRAEARIGGSVFGAVPSGHRREFFCLDENSWVWHEEWVDPSGLPRVQTTRYDVRPSGVLKSQNGHYSKVSNEELRTFKQAVVLYANKLNEQLYSGAIA